jgi:quercetin dioxygenase-like cupin family protein
MHPHGDEIIVLLSGVTTLNFKFPHGEKSVTLSDEGAYIIVPRGIWHTVKAKGSCKLLFITPREGTLHSKKPKN